jgi:ABC-2 type transport system permease protein
VLRTFFGGTLLHWFTVFALVALLSMRSVAEDRRTGIWEATLTTRVRPSTVLTGKWLALVAFYALLWAPSLLLIFIFTRYLPSGQSLDVGPVVASYLGIMWIAASLLAIGVAVSAATENQIIAAVVSFSLYLGWLMLGEYSGSEQGAGHASHWLLLLDLRQNLADMARGELASHVLVRLAAVSAIALTVATAIAARDRGDRLRLLAAALALAAAGGSVAHLVGRHGPSYDWSANRSNSLEPSTTALLAQMREPVEVLVVLPTEQVFDSVHTELMRLLRRMQQAQPMLSIRELDPMAAPDEVREWAFDLAIRPEDLSSGGAVIFQQGNRRRMVDLLAMASFRADDLGVGALAEFRAESAFRAALSEVTRSIQERLCVTTGHGEIAMRDSAVRWTAVADRMENDGVELHALRTLSPSSLDGCDALVIMGPSRGLSPDELLALGAFWAKGGHSLIAMRSRPEAGSDELARTGLELLLDARGISVLPALVVDPAAELELRPAWMTYTGYGDHPIVTDFQDRRATVWDAPLALVASSDDVVPLVQASPDAWAESDLVSLFREQRYQRGDEDAQERVVAVAQEDRNGSRLVVFGSAESMSSVWRERGIGGNDRLFVSALLWVLDRDVQMSSQDKRPEHLRLLMTKAQLKSAFVWCVVVVPLFFALFGAGLWWWRRRED